MPKPTSADATQHAEASVGKPRSTRAKARVGKKAIVGYFSPELNLALHIIAANEGTNIQSLVGEALDLLLASRGYETRNER